MRTIDHVQNVSYAEHARYGYNFLFVRSRRQTCAFIGFLAGRPGNHVVDYERAFRWTTEYRWPLHANTTRFARTSSPFSNEISDLPYKRVIPTGSHDKPDPAAASSNVSAAENVWRARLSTLVGKRQQQKWWKSRTQNPIRIISLRAACVFDSMYSIGSVHLTCRYFIAYVAMTIENCIKIKRQRVLCNYRNQLQTMKNKYTNDYCGRSFVAEENKKKTSITIKRLSRRQFKRVLNESAFRLTAGTHRSYAAGVCLNTWADF